MPLPLVRRSVKGTPLTAADHDGNLTVLETAIETGVGGVTNVAGTAPITVATGATTPVVSITPASGSTAGSMAAADFTKLAGVTAGATANATDSALRDRATHTGTQLAATVSDFTASSRAQVEAALTAGTNVTLTPSGAGATRSIQINATTAGVTDVTGTAPITSSGGATPAISIAPASGSAAGSMSSADFTKLAGVAAGATANATDAQLRDRTTHTGVQAISTVTGLQGSLDSKAANGAVTGTGITMNTARLLGRNTAANGAIEEIVLGTNLSFTGTTLNATAGGGGVSSVSGTAPITSSGGSTPDIGISAASGSAAGSMSSADFTKLAGIATGATANSTDAQLRDRATHTGTQAAGTITGLATVATSGVYNDLTGKPTLGTAAAAATGDFAPIAHVSSGGTAHANVVAAGAAGFMTGTDKTKLDGVAAGATANATDAQLRDRATHTGTQLAATISDLGTLATQSGTFSGTSSGTNTGDQTIANTSDATSHTLTLSGSGGSIQLVEGSNITLGTTGTSSAGIVTINAAGGGGATNLGYTVSTRILTSDTGTDVTLPLATGTDPGLLSASDKTKLDGIDLFNHAVITYAATVTLDMAALTNKARTITLAGDMTLATSNLATGQSLSLRLTPGSTTRNITFPADWTFMSLKPTTLLANKTCELGLKVYGATDSTVLAYFAAQP